MDCAESKNMFHYNFEASKAFTILPSLYEFQQQGQLCDVVLESSSNQGIPAHRAILAVSSPYFRAMFTGDFLESTQKNIPMKDWDYDLLQAVVAFLYNADFFLPADKVPYLMKAADFFQLKPLVQECSSFLQQRLSPSNCLSTRTFAWKHNLSSLFDACTEFTCDRFEEVTECDEFLELSCDELKDIISRDELNVCSEALVCGYVWKWLLHESDSRKGFYPELLSHCRLPLSTLLPEWFALPNGLSLLEKEQLQVYFEEARTYQESPEKRHELRFCPRIKPRKPSGLKGILTVGGCLKMSNGDFCHPFSVVEQYSVDTNSSTLLCKISPRAYFAACYYDCRLYVIGGSYGQEESLNTMLCYNIKKSEWIQCAPMRHPRRYVGVQTPIRRWYA